MFYFCADGGSGCKYLIRCSCLALSSIVPSHPPIWSHHKLHLLGFEEPGCDSGASDAVDDATFSFSVAPVVDFVGTLPSDVSSTYVPITLNPTPAPSIAI